MAGASVQDGPTPRRAPPIRDDPRTDRHFRTGGDVAIHLGMQRPRRLLPVPARRVLALAALGWLCAGCSGGLGGGWQGEPDAEPYAVPTAPQPPATSPPALSPL